MKGKHDARRSTGIEAFCNLRTPLHSVTQVRMSEGPEAGGGACCWNIMGKTTVDIPARCATHLWYYHDVAARRGCDDLRWRW
jgi:hypothetical protein